VPSSGLSGEQEARAPGGAHSAKLRLTDGFGGVSRASSTARQRTSKCGPHPSRANLRSSARFLLRPPGNSKHRTLEGAHDPNATSPPGALNRQFGMAARDSAFWKGCLRTAYDFWLVGSDSPMTAVKAGRDRAEPRRVRPSLRIGKATAEARRRIGAFANDLHVRGRMGAFPS